MLVPEWPAEGSGDLQLLAAEVCGQSVPPVSGFFVGVRRLLLALLFVQCVSIQMNQCLDQSSCQRYSEGTGLLLSQA